MFLLGFVVGAVSLAISCLAIENAEANQALDDTADKAKDTGKSFDDLSSTGEKTESKLTKFFNGAAKVGAWSTKVVAAGIGVATTAMTALTTKALNMGGELEQNMGGSEAVVPLEKNTGWIQKIATNLYELTVNAQSRSNIDDILPKQSEALQNQQISVMKVLNDKVDQMIDIMSEYFPEFSARMQHQIVLDTGTLVGATAPAMDRQLGLIYKRKERGL